MKWVGRRYRGQSRDGREEIRTKREGGGWSWHSYTYSDTRLDQPFGSVECRGEVKWGTYQKKARQNAGGSQTRNVCISPPDEPKLFEFWSVGFPIADIVAELHKSVHYALESRRQHCKPTIRIWPSSRFLDLGSWRPV